MESLTIDGRSYIPLLRSTVIPKDFPPDCKSLLDQHWVLDLNPERLFLINAKERFLKADDYDHPQQGLQHTQRLEVVELNATYLELLQKIESARRLQPGLHLFNQTDGSEERPAMQWLYGRRKSGDLFAYLVDAESTIEFGRADTRPRPGYCMTTGQRVWVKNSSDRWSKARDLPGSLPNDIFNEHSMLALLHSQLHEAPELTATIAPMPLLLFEPPSCPYESALICEYFQQDLYDWIEQRVDRDNELYPPLSIQEQHQAIKRIGCMLTALERIHLIHADLKIRNCLIKTPTIELPDFVLADFGASFIEDQYPIEHVNINYMMGYFTPECVSIDDCIQTLEVLEIVYEKDLVRRCMALAERDNHRPSSPFTPPQLKPSSMIIQAAEHFQQNHITCEQDLSSADKDSLISSGIDIATLQMKARQQLHAEMIHLFRLRETYQFGRILYTLFTGRKPLYRPMDALQSPDNFKSKQPLPSIEDCTMNNRHRLEEAQIQPEIIDLLLHMLNENPYARADQISLQKMIKQITNSSP